MEDDNKTEKIAGYFSQYPLRHYPKGQILIFAQENPEHIFYLVSGRVRQYAVSDRGDEIIVNIFKPQAFFPMSWAVNRLPNMYFYKTEETVDLHIVPVDDALRFIRDNPDVMLDLLKRLYRGMDGLLGRLVHLMSGTATSRLLYELLIDCRRFGERQPDGSCIVSATVTDLAARTGLSRETVSREISRLKASDIVVHTNNTITVKNIGQLAELLGSE